jgi:hypothetical protein
VRAPVVLINRAGSQQRRRRPATLNQPLIAWCARAELIPQLGASAIDRVVEVAADMEPGGWAF